MSRDRLTRYHSTGSPNSRRVRIFLAEKGLEVPLVAIDLYETISGRPSAAA
jgi:glutathione S-transferase